MFYGFSFFLSYQMGLQHWAPLEAAEPYASIAFILWMVGSLLAAANPKLWPARLSVTLGLLIYLGLHFQFGAGLPVGSVLGLLLIFLISTIHWMRPEALRLHSVTIPASACALAVAVYFLTGFAAHYILLAVLAIYDPRLAT